MPVIRIVLLLLVLGGLSLLLAQNWLPVLQLVFLGMRSQALPLAIWILIGVAAGALTSLLITALFRLSNYVAAQHLLRRRGRDVETTQRSSGTQRPDAPSSANPRPPLHTNPNPSDASDWDQDSTQDDEDWGFEDDPVPTRNPTSQDNIRDYTTYERQQQPKSGSQSGSVYSYSYREPKNSGVGKTESVYDADYRVITPPYQGTHTAKNEEDWGFEDDEEFEDKGNSPKGR